MSQVLNTTLGPKPYDDIFYAQLSGADISGWNAEVEREGGEYLEHLNKYSFLTGRISGEDEAQINVKFNLEKTEYSRYELNLDHWVSEHTYRFDGYHNVRFSLVINGQEPEEFQGLIPDRNQNIDISQFLTHGENRIEVKLWSLEPFPQHGDYTIHSISLTEIYGNE